MSNKMMLVKFIFNVCRWQV